MICFVFTCHRSSLRQKEEELKKLIYGYSPCNLRDILKCPWNVLQNEEIIFLLCLFNRLATEDAGSRNINDPYAIKNPVSTSKVTGFYQEMKLLQWPKIKDYLKSNGVSPRFTTGLVQVQQNATVTLLNKCDWFYNILFNQQLVLLWIRVHTLNSWYSGYFIF